MTDRYVPLARVIRNGFDECLHAGTVVIVDPAGRVRYAAGDPSVPVFPRSSNKPFQAIAMLETGARLAGADLALAAASHSGEPMHTERALAVLAAAGLAEDDLQCPPDLPMHQPTLHAVLSAGGTARRIYMNCSGKHAGMLAACRAAGADTANYLDPQHPYQQRVQQVVQRLSGEQVAAVGVDGCGAPLLAISLTGLARAFGSVVTAAPGTAERTVADAMREHPLMVGGTDRDDTVVMTAHPGVLMKGGAEGVHVAALADGHVVAIKIADGAARARMPVMVATLRALGLSSPTLDDLAVGAVLGGGRRVGSVEVHESFAPTL